MAHNLYHNENILAQDEFELFRDLILAESGICFSDEQKSLLSFSIYERMQKNRISSFKQYYNFLTSFSSGRAELLALLDTVTIGETDFFRTLAHFDVLGGYVLPEIIKRKFNFLNKDLKNLEDAASIMLKIWSAGCSTGEEPYSLAIKLLEVFPDANYHNTAILATDVNRERIDKARFGRYGRRAIRNLSPEILEKYFTVNGNEYEIADRVKSLVRFTRHNLATDDFNLDYMRDVDIIFCRNVLIYFNLDNTKRIIDNFYNCLNDQGYLFIGPAESLWQISDKFKPIEFPHAFIYTKTMDYQAEAEKPFISIPELDLADIKLTEEPPSEESFRQMEENIALKEEREKKVSREASEVLYQEGIRLFNIKEHEKALELFDKVITNDPAFIKAYFAKATILANQGKYQEAVAELKRIIKIDNLFIEAYYLMGVLSDRLGDLGDAIEQFKKVIYISPEVVLAYFNLANIFYCQKKFKKAEREFRNAINMLEKKSKDEIVVFSEDVTVDVLLAACKKNIETVKQRI
ncbi:MAG: hypothetical protein COV72_03580 [Candidatus Omnitrophica bacterium CG11_big_fil_rev_8_21_14_0_20_42_13]|uniref:protein-glutamate O-methyltransferase n=1 Tax=Candidatus Ghiorseimicrobium undicola TaxID=1974746 RepID=A0A2H0LY77_9BACT|nr:MAG: hypothetical protein COV72_03580 [Candidatus Omnitrophica bacterium CG11_big_fil_rev_8_21_14_0_20_42_13]